MMKLGFGAHIVPLISYVTLQPFVNFGTACFICDPPGHEVPLGFPAGGQECQRQSALEGQSGDQRRYEEQ